MTLNTARLRRRARTTLAGALLCAGPAAAGAPPAEAPLARVVVEGSANGAVDTARQTVRRAELERYGDSNLADTLARVPGVTVDRSRAKGPVLQLRGLGAGYTQVMLNGEPVGPTFSLDSVPPSLVERIEINRVPQADVSGQAIAGTINIVTRSAGSAASSELKAVLAHENDGPLANVNGQLAGSFDPATAYLVAAGLSRELFERPASIDETGRAADEAPLRRHTARRSGNRMDGLNLLGNVKRRASQGETLTVDASVNLRDTTGGSEDSVTTHAGPYPEFSDSTIAYAVRTASGQGTVRWQRPLGEGGRIDVDVGSRYVRRESDADFAGFDERGRHVLTRIVDGVATDRDVNANGKLTWPAGGGHALVAGWQGSRSQRAERRVQDDTTPTGRPPVDLDEAYTARVRRLALYVQDEWSIAPRSSLYLGARWERLVTATRGTGLADPGNRAMVLTPTVQFSWGLPGRPDDLLRVSAGRSFKPPQTVELVPRRFLSNNNSPTSPDTIGNPALRPELARSLDLGYEHAPKRGVALSASAYWRHIDDVVLPELALRDGRWLAIPVNNGGARVHGANLELRVRLNDLAASLPPLEVRANAERNWSRLDAVALPDNRLERQQPKSGGVSVAYKAAQWSAGGSLNITSTRYARLSPLQGNGAGVRRVLDAYGVWKAAGGQVRLTLANILRQDTVSQADYFDAGHVADDPALAQRTATRGFRALRLTYERKL